MEVREDGVLISTAQDGDAISEVSQRVGFEVKLPASIPDGLRLVSIDYGLGPEGAPNALKIASLTYGPKDEARRGEGR